VNENHVIIIKRSINKEHMDIRILNERLNNPDI